MYAENMVRLLYKGRHARPHRIWPRASHPANHHAPLARLARATQPTGYCLDRPSSPGRALIASLLPVPPHYLQGQFPPPSGLCSSLPLSLRRFFTSPSKMTERSPFFHSFSSSIIFLHSIYICLEPYFLLLVFCIRPISSVTASFVSSVPHKAVIIEG